MLSYVPLLDDYGNGDRTYNVIQSNENIIAKNLIMRNNVWGHIAWDNSSGMAGGVDLFCQVISAKSLSISDSLLEVIRKAPTKK